MGEWETVLVIWLDTDVQTWTTNWVFRRDGTCRYRQTVHSVLEDATRVKLRDCAYTLNGPAVTITFLDTGALLTTPHSFAALSRDRLILEGIEYRRIQ